MDRARLAAWADALADLTGRVLARSIPGLTMIPGASSLLAATIRETFSPAIALDDADLRLLLYAFAQDIGAVVGQRPPVDWSDEQLRRATEHLLAALGATDRG
jgi:hypothetical protein